MYLADMLSHAYIPLDLNHKDHFTQVNAVSHLRISEQRLKELQQATKNDETVTLLKSVILHGWPETKESLPTPYFY